MKRAMNTCPGPVPGPGGLGPQERGETVGQLMVSLLQGWRLFFNTPCVFVGLEKR